MHSVCGYFWCVVYGGVLACDYVSMILRQGCPKFLQ